MSERTTRFAHLASWKDIVPLLTSTDPVDHNTAIGLLEDRDRDLEDFVSLIAEPWLAYTPTWTAQSGTAGTIGNGTLQGRYRVLGRLVFVSIDLITGSTTTYGTGFWGFGLPSGIACAGNANSRTLLSAWAYDLSSSNEYVGVARGSGSVGAFDNTSLVPAFPNAFAGASRPFVWAAGDLLSIFGVLERG